MPRIEKSEELKTIEFTASLAEHAIQKSLGQPFYMRFGPEHLRNILRLARLGALGEMALAVERPAEITITLDAHGNIRFEGQYREEGVLDGAGDHLTAALEAAFGLDAGEDENEQ